MRAQQSTLYLGIRDNTIFVEPTINVILMFMKFNVKSELSAWGLDFSVEPTSPSGSYI